MWVESLHAASGPLGGWIHTLEEPLPPRRMVPKPAKPITRDWDYVAWQAFCHRHAAKLRQRLSERLGVVIEALEALWVGVGNDERGRRYSTWPERWPTGQVCGVVTRYESGKKLMLCGSHHGLYLPDSVLSLPRGSVIYSPEGGSDVAALLSAGLPAIGRPSNTGGVQMLATLCRQRGWSAVVLGEQDAKPERRGTVATCSHDCAGCAWCWPGKFGMQHTLQRLRSAGVRCWGRMPRAGKDAREWLRLVGTDTLQQELRCD